MNKSSPYNFFDSRFWFFPGAQRVGTHFQLNIVMDILRQSGISFVHFPGNRLNIANKEEFHLKLRELGERPEKHILINSHWRYRKERDTLLSYPTSPYFLIWRDFHDSLVSYYYYLTKRRNRSYNDFNHFYWLEGWQYLWRQSIHYQTWHNIGKHPRVFHTDYSRLVTNFEEEAERLINFMGLKNINLSELKNNVSIENRRISINDEKGTFYRKGKLGEYAELVKDKRILNHVENTLRWGKKHNFVFKRIYYEYSIWLSKFNLRK